ncbi:MAG: hypothetical protein VX644_05960 [Planctomycetota bacterium]|nr:hypothetical protein [Planctomycetota bacterium]
MPRNNPCWLICLLAGNLPVMVGAAADDPAAMGLLVQENVTLVTSSLPGGTQQDLAPLTDGKTGHLLEIKLEPGIALDLTYQLPAVATCQQLVVTANTRDLTKRQLPRIEVLVSTLSSQAGFQSIRSLTLKSASDAQQLDLPPTAAHWIIVRIMTPLEPITLSIAEIDIQGHQGPPQTRYAFKEAPAKAFQVLAAVQKSVDVKINPDETSLFKDAGDGKLDQWSLAEAALLSNGILEAGQRKKYLDQIDQITGQAQKLLKDTATPYQQGEQLLKWLHANVMKAGYEKHQTDLSVILDTGKFNCVSSATLYNIVALRLGLDVRAIEVPDHAFSIQYVGTKHADVETTNAAGFNPARDPRILERFTRETGFNYIPDRHADKRREVTNIGLMALTYYNHGVTHSENEDYAAALVDYFRALSLDPEFPSAIQNVLSTLHHWSGDLSKASRFEKALDVVSIGLHLAPDDHRFHHNQKALWQAWALDEIENDRREAALSILARAAKALPEGGFEQMQSYAFIQPGEKMVQDKLWAEALQLAENGLKTLPPAARKELQRWRNNVYNRWTIATIDQKKYAEVADILERAMKADPDEIDFKRNIGFAIQEWLSQTESNEGLQAAEDLLKRVNRRFRDIRDVQEVARNFLGRAAFRLAKDKQFKLAETLLDRHQKQLPEGTYQDLVGSVFEMQATGLREQNKWELAVDVYQRGLKKIPGDRQLKNNLIFTWNKWAEGYQQKKDWSTAGEIYLKALTSGIDNREMGQRIGFCVQELARDTWTKDGPLAAEKHLTDWVTRQPELKTLRVAVAVYMQGVVQKHQRDQQPAKALVAANRCRKLLTEKDHTHFIRIVCDRWSQAHVKNSEWNEGLAVYTQGLKSLPGDSHLTRNAVVTWNQWASGFIKKKEWGEAIKIYDRALEQFPRERTLRNNLKYCLQQANQ